MSSPHLYLHYPLCKHHCSYCDFNVYREADWKGWNWLPALSKHLEDWMKDGKVPSDLKTLYLGGGTPSLMQLSELKELVTILKKHFRFSDALEFTLECNPESLSEELLVGFKEIGVNRLSLGVQSFQSTQLKRLERLATQKNLSQSLEWISKYFTNFSIDLMIGTPDQTLESLDLDLKEILKWNPPHVSIYLLTLAKDHLWLTHPAMKDRVSSNQLCESLYFRVCEFLSSLKYHHYEISNFAKPGFESRHNTNYWNVESSYLALGPGAHGYLRSSDGKRFRYENIRDPKEWMESERGFLKEEFLSADQERLEKIYMGLRTKKPLDLSLLDTRKIPYLVESGLVVVSHGSLTPSTKGWLLQESLAEALIP